MKKMLFLMILLSSALYATDRGPDEAWFRETLQKKLSDSKKYDLTEIKARTDEILAKSVPCKTSAIVYEDYNVYIAMTFDLPETIWAEYSPQLEKMGGSFVIRGLPNDSFFDFAKRVKFLREKGITAPIQLNPKFFEKFQIELAPEIILVDGNLHDKIAGTVSIRYALEQFAKFGDTTNTEDLVNRLSGDAH